MYFILALVGGYIGFDYKLVLGGVIYFIGTYCSLIQPAAINKRFTFGVVFLLPFLILLYFSLFQLRLTYVSLPSSFFICIGCIAGLLFYKNNSKLIPIGLLLFITCWLTFLKKPFYSFFTYNTINGSILINKPVTNFYDSNNIMQPLSMPNKIYLLDFWTSTCGVCFSKFPIIDSISKLVDTNKVEIIVVNIPIRNEHKEDNFKILNKFNYSFKKLYATSLSIADSLEIIGYPTTIVIKNNQAIFRGSFEAAVLQFKVLIK